MRRQPMHQPSHKSLAAHLVSSCYIYRNGTWKMKKKRQRKYAAILFVLLFCLSAGGKTAQEPMMIGYQGKFNAAGWSGSGNDHSPCLQGEGYLTGLRLGLVNRPGKAEGEVVFQAHAEGRGWLDEEPQEDSGTAAWMDETEEGLQERRDSDRTGEEIPVKEEPPLEAVRLWLTQDLEQEYDIYYRVYQNGGWQNWTSNGCEAGVLGEGFWISGIQVLIRKKGMDPPEEAPEETKEILPAVDPNRPMVALTFDDGPRASVTDRILQYLRDAGGKATFFMIGNRVAANEDSVNQMVAQGSQVGNHTFDHQYITKLNLTEMQQQIGGTSQAILEACGILPTVVRPPGGKVDQASLNVLATMGMPAVMWSIDTRDWQHRDAEKTVETVLSQVTDGDIILMHDIYPSTADAAAVLIPALTERGYQLVTVSELAMYRGGMLPGHKYSKFRPES